MTFYKVREKATGLFSCGGFTHNGKFNKSGKTWNQIGHVKSHLTQYAAYADWYRWAKDYLERVEIVEYKVDGDLSFEIVVPYEPKAY